MKTFDPSATHVIRTENRLRSRHMLPMEMLASVALGLAGMSGAFPVGWLHVILERQGYALGWGLGLMPIAVAAFVVSATEWFWGSRWENGHLRFSIFARWWLSLLSAVAWLIVLYMMATITQPVTSMVITAITFMPFHFWSFWVNLRVHTALDPTKSTERLKQRMRAGEI